MNVCIIQLGFSRDISGWTSPSSAVWLQGNATDLAFRFPFKECQISFAKSDKFLLIFFYICFTSKKRWFCYFLKIKYYMLIVFSRWAHVTLYVTIWHGSRSLAFSTVWWQRSCPQTTVWGRMQPSPWCSQPRDRRLTHSQHSPLCSQPMNRQLERKAVVPSGNCALRQTLETL